MSEIRTAVAETIRKHPIWMSVAGLLALTIIFEGVASAFDQERFPESFTCEVETGTEVTAPITSLKCDVQEQTGGRPRDPVGIFLSVPRVVSAPRDRLHRKSRLSRLKDLCRRLATLRRRNTA
jgi:hypothetical protein